MSNFKISKRSYEGFGYFGPIAVRRNIFVYNGKFLGHFVTLKRTVNARFVS